jgi:hypothetical protein
MYKLIALLLFVVHGTAVVHAEPATALPDARNQEFRDHVIAHVRARAHQWVSGTPARESALLTRSWNNRYKHSFWYAEVSAYFNGRKIASAAASQKSVGKPLDEAVQKIFASERMAKITEADLASIRFLPAR